MIRGKQKRRTITSTVLCPVVILPIRSVACTAKSASLPKIRPNLRKTIKALIWKKQQFPQKHTVSTIDVVVALTGW